MNIDYNNKTQEELEKEIDDKIKSLMGDVEKPKEYRWDDNGFMKYKDELAAKLKQENPYWALGAHEEIAERDLPLINPLLEKNLIEYIKGEQLSDIPVGSEKYTVSQILRIRNNMGGVLEAIKDLSIYAVDEEKGRTRIFGRYIIK